MLNIGGGEILVIALVALIVVGPEQLPGVLRKAGRYASQVKSMTSSIRDEFMSGIDEVDPTKWTGDIDGRGDGSADKPIVPRGYSDRHDEMRRPEASPGTGESSAAPDPTRIKPKTAQMASVEPEPDTASVETDTAPAEPAAEAGEPEPAQTEPTQTEAKPSDAADDADEPSASGSDDE